MLFVGDVRVGPSAGKYELRPVGSTDELILQWQVSLPHTKRFGHANEAVFITNRYRTSLVSTLELIEPRYVNNAYALDAKSFE